MSWAYLFAAILLEVCGTTCMKLSLGPHTIGAFLAALPFLRP